MLKYSRLQSYIRLYSIKHATKQPIKYTETINLPKTKFPNRLTAAKRMEIERQLLEERFATAYSYQETHNKEPAFVLHDGPPYANGDLHMGHAVNKILKDICLKGHVAEGTKVHYIPGWDCHGLPIELKATSSSESSKEDAVMIRKKCREYAIDAMERQKTEFRAWGILANWQSEEHTYLTLRPEFIVRQLKMFLDFYERQLVYRDLKPVYWSPSSRTALAEAELEYDANFVSPSVYVRFELETLPKTISNIGSIPVYALVWTTTPWTLPSNQAICYNAAFDYALVRLQQGEAAPSTEALYLIANDLISNFEEITKMKCEKVYSVKGSELNDCTYRHPVMRTAHKLKFFDATHVQASKGTGLVHTAPAHGPEDFLVSLKSKIPVISYINQAGAYTANAPDFLRGKSVLKDGDRLVLAHIADDVVYAGQLMHSHPIDWRTKEPVIIRASKQWFMNTDALKERALAELSNIQIYPRVNAEASRKALETQVRKRPYWCISRQRVWGTPIPVFYRKDNGDAIINGKIIEHICQLVREYGNIDFWWSEDIAEIIPKHLLMELNLNAEDIVRGADIFDIWFDSGSTWSSVLGVDRKADLYLEGYDQFTGWFQSSLLISIAARQHAPYNALFVHGFTVDEQGYKMSKSLGNVISPKEIIKKYGIDVLRWWVASHATQHMSITVSDKLLQQSAESLSKVRSILRYLNGVVGVDSKDYETENVCDEKVASQLNQYLLSNLYNFDKELQRAYNSFEYNRVVAQIQNFIANQLSAVYINSIKDRLYCGTDDQLKSIRNTLRQCYEILCKALWPLATFLVEESWSYYAPNVGFIERSITANPAWKNEMAENVIGTALNVKRLINQSAVDKNTWNLAVEIKCAANGNALERLQMLQSELNKFHANTELCELLQVHKAKLIAVEPAEADISVRVELLDNITLCPRCRRFALDIVNDITCQRCANVLKTK